MIFISHFSMLHTLWNNIWNAFETEQLLYQAAYSDTLKLRPKGVRVVCLFESFDRMVVKRC